MLPPRNARAAGEISGCLFSRDAVWTPCYGIAAGRDDRLRALTEAEGRVIAVLLGGAGTTERDRLHRTAVPRSTYHAARKRAYVEGWLTDRYVPDPARFGRPLVVFALVRPFVDHTTELVEAWAADPTNVLTWASPQLALGVFFRPATAKPTELASALAPTTWSRLSYLVVADARGPGIPVYFDYEGLWGHLAELPGTATYPNGLGGDPALADGPAAPITDHQRWAATELVHRSFVPDGASRTGRLVGPLGLPFSQQRLLKLGWVVHRVLLDPGRVPPFHGRAADQVTFIVGTLREGQRPEALFGTLTRECRVFPFLYATDGPRLLIGALGRNPAVPPPPAAAPESRRPVLPTLQAALEGIEILSENAGALRARVDHRYDRILPKPGPR